MRVQISDVANLAAFLNRLQNDILSARAEVRKLQRTVEVLQAKADKRGPGRPPKVVEDQAA